MSGVDPADISPLSESATHRALLLFMRANVSKGGTLCAAEMAEIERWEAPMYAGSQNLGAILAVSARDPGDGFDLSGHTALKEEKAHKAKLRAAFLLQLTRATDFAHQRFPCIAD